MQYCHEGGFTVLGGLVDDWPSYLSRGGVHPSRFGNKVLTEYQVACTLSIHLERSHIQQCYKETRAPSSWTSWTRQDKHPCHHRGGVSPTWFAYFHFFSCSKWTFHSTSSCLESQQTKILQGAGFSLSGGVRVRCKGSKAWWTWDSLPSPIFHGTSVPSRGKAKQRSVESLSLLLLHPRCCLCGDVVSLNHILWGCQEDPLPADLVSPPPINEQWEALLSSADRDIQTRVLARAEDAIVKHSLAAYVA
ncbi:hypothetical protein HPB49_022370 [Dermacentor silvarum]|uniref:Uncharacterized protein n=1 Tax=Dermacentor silvarum TaxID=543639 RepID=A0ACB8E3S9_DERSI|nr:hypothetical protein HPB49_022370 [Dermacentor silvarum]